MSAEIGHLERIVVLREQLFNRAVEYDDRDMKEIELCHARIALAQTQAFEVFSKQHQLYQQPQTVVVGEFPK